MSAARLVTEASRKTSAAVIGVSLTVNTQLSVVAADAATEEIVGRIAVKSCVEKCSREQRSVH